MAVVEIDKGSGFCFGVVTAIRKAEEELDKSGHLYCLGDIVHNSNEVERLEQKGLETITHEQLRNLHNVKVLLRAHGEPPETYEIARQNNIEIIDATCPVVLQLQRRIHSTYNSKNSDGRTPQIVIYGKNGHAEVNGLVGQTNGEALVIQDEQDINKIDFNRDIYLYSQTTKSLQGFKEIVSHIAEKNNGLRKFESYDTICRQVANRIDKIREFATEHELIIFVSGKKSSNGKILFAECLDANPSSYLISSEDEINPDWLKDKTHIGICGATSTPMWLMNKVKDRIEELL